jgi:hypothetical protein
MCFSTVSARPKEIPQMGWKIFNKRGNSICFEFYPLVRSLPRTTKVPTNRWLKARTGNLLSNNIPYRNGFHCFITEDGAKNWCSPAQILDF